MTEVFALESRRDRLVRLGAEADRRCGEIREQVIAEFGCVPAKHTALLAQLRDVEMLRLEAAEDVKTRGLREQYSNGKQRLERKNPAIDTVLKASATAAKVIAAMGLSKARNKPGGEAVAGSDDDDLDNY